jgi:hypothetical protein
LWYLCVRLHLLQSGAAASRWPLHDEEKTHRAGTFHADCARPPLDSQHHVSMYVISNACHSLCAGSNSSRYAITTPITTLTNGSSLTEVQQMGLLSTYNQVYSLDFNVTSTVRLSQRKGNTSVSVRYERRGPPAAADLEPRMIRLEYTTYNLEIVTEVLTTGNSTASRLKGSSAPLSTGAIIGIAFAACPCITLLVVSVLGCFLYVRYRRKRRQQQQAAESAAAPEPSPPVPDLDAPATETTSTA